MSTLESPVINWRSCTTNTGRFEDTRTAVDVMNAGEHTTSTCVTGGGATQSASTSRSTLVCAYTVSTKPLATKRISEMGGGPTRGLEIGTPPCAMAPVSIAGIASLQNVWTSITGQEKSSSLICPTACEEQGERLSPKSPSVILCVPIVTELGPQLVRGRNFSPERASDLTGEPDGSTLKVRNQSSPDTTSAPAPRDSLVVVWPFGANKGPGASARKHTRSCRCVLARRHGGNASALAHTNVPVHVRADRPIVTGLRSPALVSGRSLPSMTANSTEPRALDELLRGYRETPTLACGHGTASPSGGPTASRWSVASAMTSDSRSSRSHQRGLNAVTAGA